jgi:O-acetyl-ADP-ribose deacetylase
MLKERISILMGDITQLKADAIVNAANTTLLGGGGVDGAIHRAAGPELLNECKKLNGCKTGEAKITAAYNLPSKFIIHTVGPIWYGGYKDEEKLLKSCYLQSLTIAKKNKINVLAFPAISTGAYRFPREMAAKIAINETISFLHKNKFPNQVIFVFLDEESHFFYDRLLTDLV